MLKISTAPHINSPQDTRSIMLDVIIALLPALAAALLIFGLGALIVVLTAVAGWGAFESDLPLCPENRSDHRQPVRRRYRPASGF